MISGSLIAVIVVFAVAVAVAGISIYRWQKLRQSGGENFVKGLLAIVEGDFASAKNFLQLAARQNTHNIEAFVLLGDLLRQEGKLVAAKRIHTSLLARAFIKPGQKARVYKSLALDAFREGELPKALEYIKQAIALKPDGWSYDFALDVLERLERFGEAAELLAKTGADGKLMALYKVEEGKRVAEDDPHRARLLYKEALKHDQDCIAAMLAIGDAYASEGRYRDALEWWSKVLERFPQRGHIVLDRIESAYYELGEFDKAASLYRKVLLTHPDAWRIRLALARIHEKMGELDEALRIIDAAEERNEVLTLAKARLACIMGRSKEASAAIDEVLQGKLAPRYTCSSCGYSTSEPLWRCPKCGEWESFGV